MTTAGADSVAIVYGDIRGALTTDALQVVQQAPGVEQSARARCVRHAFRDDATAQMGTRPVRGRAIARH